MNPSIAPAPQTPQDLGWEACGSGVDGSFHDAAGNPLVNTTKLPDLKGLVATALAKNLAPWWCVGAAGAPSPAQSSRSVPHAGPRVAARGLDVAACTEAHPSRPAALAS